MRTCRNNIPWRGLSAFRNWNNVIPCIGRSTAIDTESAGIFEQHLLPNNRNAFNAPSLLVAVILSSFSVLGILGISFARINISTRATPGTVDFFFWKPLFAITAPFKTSVFHGGAFTFSRLIFIDASTLVAPGRKSIASMSINRKFSNRLPRCTVPAPLEALMCLVEIFVKRDTNSLCGNFHDSDFAAHLFPFCQFL